MKAVVPERAITLKVDVMRLTSLKAVSLEIMAPLVTTVVNGIVVTYCHTYHIARKFGGELNLVVWHAVLGETAKLKSAKIYTVCMYVWPYCSRPPNLNHTV